MKFVFLGIMSDESVASMHATSFEKRKEKQWLKSWLKAQAERYST